MAEFLRPPGVVIQHAPASTGYYLSSPSIAVLSPGVYLASYSKMGRGATNTDSFVHRSDDCGVSWRLIAEVRGQMWSKLFLHHGALYLIGTDHCDRYDGRLNGKMVIRRSMDEGVSWTAVTGPETGLLSDHDGYHTAPTPLALHNGRIWKAFEFAPTPDRQTWRAFVISAPVDADLVRRDSWRFSDQIESWTGYQWIEGNMIESPDNEVVNVLRTNDRYRVREGFYDADEPASLVHVSPDGMRLTHGAAEDRIKFPGGGSKFTIRRDPRSGYHIALVNPQSSANLYRNVLAMSTAMTLCILREPPLMTKRAARLGPTTPTT